VVPRNIGELPKSLKTLDESRPAYRFTVIVHENGSDGPPIQGFPGPPKRKHSVSRLQYLLISSTVLRPGASGYAYVGQQFAGTDRC